MGIFQKNVGRQGPLPFGSKLKMPTHSASSEQSQSSSGQGLYPLSSPALEEVPIWNILPSYQLYESTFSKNLDPASENFNESPPTYEVSPSASSSSENEADYFANRSTTASNVPAVRWENSIIGNSHRLKSLETFNKSLADQVRIDIVFTKSPGIKGRVPDIYDPSGMEFSQGDSIHGFVRIVNTSEKALTFDMFSVMWEGRITVNSNDNDSSSKPLIFYKFLNMFDYNASWTPAYFDDSESDDNDLVDPVDGNTLRFSFDRKLDPGVTYKKFFNFRIPDKLLDCACETHEIPSHCQLLPTLGLDKSVFLQRLRKLRELPKKNDRSTFSPTSKHLGSNKYPNPVTLKKAAPTIMARDYGFPDTSISYSVETRLVGKSSSYKIRTSTEKDEFIIIKQESSPLRVIPLDLSSSLDEDDLALEKRYEGFVKDIKRSIDLGHKLDEGEEQSSLDRRASTAKHTYQKGIIRPTENSSNQDNYEVYFPYKRKMLTHTPKIVGIIRTYFPKTEHLVRYVTPYIFTPFSSHISESSSQVKTNIVLEYENFDTPLKTASPPEIKTITGKLVSYTVRAKKYPIPIDITQNMKFRNIVSHDDNIEKYLVSPFKRYLSELTGFVSKYGMEAMNVSQQTMMDVKSLANLESKTNIVRIENIQVSSDGGVGSWTQKDGTFENEIEIQFDLQTLFAKDSKNSAEDKIKGALVLVPSFQSCIVCRYYYVLIEIKLGNGDVLPLKIPLKIVK